MIAREAMQRQLRPYVYLEMAKLKVSHMLMVDLIEDTFEATIVLKNYGQSPAKDVQIFVAGTVGDYWSQRTVAALDDAVGIKLSDVPAGEAREQDGFFGQGLKAAHPFICEETQSVFVEGQVQYKDLFGNEYVTFFQRAFTGASYWHSTPAITPNYNAAT